MKKFDRLQMLLVEQWLKPGGLRSHVKGGWGVQGLTHVQLGGCGQGCGGPRFHVRGGGKPGLVLETPYSESNAS